MPSQTTSSIGQKRESRLGPIVGLLLAWLAVASPATAADPVYRFIDAEGVLHFSDVPSDARYSRVESASQDGLVITPPPRVRVPSEHDYDRLIARVGSRYGVHPAIVKAVIAAESNFEPGAVSRAGAQGMMQLMPATAAELGVERPFGVVENLDGGVRYLRAMLDRYGDVTRALAAYNAGPGAVDRHGGVPPYPETEAYVKRVLEYYRVYRSQFDRSVRRRAGRSERGAAPGQGSPTAVHGAGETMESQRSTWLSHVAPGRVAGTVGRSGRVPLGER